MVELKIYLIGWNKGVVYYCIGIWGCFYLLLVFNKR